MDNLTSTTVIAGLKHGQKINSKVLGDIDIVKKSSAFNSGFDYVVPVSQVTTNQSMLLLLENLYVVVEPLEGQHMNVLFPIDLARFLCVDHQMQLNAISEPELIRLLTSQLTQEYPIGVCLRGQQEQVIRCVYKVLPKNAALSVLDHALNRIIDFALLLLEWHREYRHMSLGRHLERSVESHRF